MIRLFVGLDVSEALADRLVALQAGLPGARWVPRENLHLTLAFIGEVSEPDAEDLAAALDGLDGRPLDIEPDGLGWFGRPHQPASLVMHARRAEPLVHFQKRLTSLLRTQGHPPEARKFAPHVTLARLKRVGEGDVERYLTQNMGMALPGFTAETFHLYSSRLGHAGALYRREVSYALSRQPR